MTDYRPIFDPPPPTVAALPLGMAIGDRTAPGSYVFDAGLVLAVNVALATGRPLLLRGRPGSGKSSMAASAAFALGWRFYSQTITSRTQARDLLWTVDDVARLSDATAGSGQARERERYVEPGLLWWAFDPVSAAGRGLAPSAMGAPVPDPNLGTVGAAHAVVLLDEIDKADPDVPNDLLEPLGWYRFRTDRGLLVTAAAEPLVVITTNGERDLPRAFLRRCVAYQLALPTVERLVEIARGRFGAASEPLFLDIIRALPAAMAADDRTVDISIAEYLDLVRAAAQLRLSPGDPFWAEVVAATLEPAASRP
jgi:MoxR-like ATPase